MKAAEERAQHIGGREAGGFKAEKQNQPEDEPGGQQREEIEGGEAVAGALPGNWLWRKAIGHGIRPGFICHKQAQKYTKKGPGKEKAPQDCVLPFCLDIVRPSLYKGRGSFGKAT